MPVNKRRILQGLLRFMARAIIRKYRPLIVGITGSVGKSSTKEAVGLVLSAAFRVGMAEGNHNNEIGLPLTVIGARGGGGSLFGWARVGLKWLALMTFRMQYPEILVLEFGVDRPGDMDYLLDFVPVKIGVVTNVSSSHIAFFGTLSNIAKEKGRLIAALPEDGTAILNADDKSVLRMQAKTKVKTYTFGFDEKATVRADHLIFHREAKRVEGFSFKLNVEGKSIPVRLPKVVAKHHIPAVLAAACVGLALKMHLVDIASALEAFEPLPGRLRILPGRDNTILLDDTYNASPVSTRAALEVLQDLTAPRKVVVLGDMLELGAGSDEDHRALAPFVVASGANIVIAIGSHMRGLYEALLASGFGRRQALWLPEPIAAITLLLDIIRPDDLILLKGSQALRLEKLTEQLLVDPREAKTFLCRQSEAWRIKPFVPPAEWTE